MNTGYRVVAVRHRAERLSGTIFARIAYVKRSEHYSQTMIMWFLLLRIISMGLQPG